MRPGPHTERRGRGGGLLVLRAILEPELSPEEAGVCLRGRLPWVAWCRLQKCTFVTHDLLISALRQVRPGMTGRDGLTSSRLARNLPSDEL